jgi:hypothetical protein
MIRKTVIGLLAVLALVVLTGCAGPMYHNYMMRGTVLEAKGDTVTVCVGSADGAKVGHEFKVYMYDKTPDESGGHSGVYKRVETGRIKIIDIVDEHMAHAKIISGEVKEHYIVELD